MEAYRLKGQERRGEKIGINLPSKVREQCSIGKFNRWKNVLSTLLIFTFVPCQPAGHVVRVSSWERTNKSRSRSISQSNG